MLHLSRCVATKDECMAIFFISFCLLTLYIYFRYDTVPTWNLWRQRRMTIGITSDRPHRCVGKFYLFIYFSLLALYIFLRYDAVPNLWRRWRTTGHNNTLVSFFLLFISFCLLTNFVSLFLGMKRTIQCQIGDDDDDDKLDRQGGWRTTGHITLVIFIYFNSEFLLTNINLSGLLWPLVLNLKFREMNLPSLTRSLVV